MAVFLDISEENRKDYEMGKACLGRRFSAAARTFHRIALVRFYKLIHEESYHEFICSIKQFLRKLVQEMKRILVSSYYFIASYQDIEKSHGSLHALKNVNWVSQALKKVKYC